MSSNLTARNGREKQTEEIAFSLFLCQHVVQKHFCTCDNTPLAVTSGLSSAGVKLPFCHKMKCPLNWLFFYNHSEKKESRKEDNFSLWVPPAAHTLVSRADCSALGKSATASELQGVIEKVFSWDFQKLWIIFLCGTHLGKKTDSAKHTVDVHKYTLHSCSSSHPARHNPWPLYLGEQGKLL